MVKRCGPNAGAALLPFYSQDGFRKQSVQRRELLNMLKSKSKTRFLPNLTQTEREGNYSGGFATLFQIKLYSDIFFPGKDLSLINSDHHGSGILTIGPID